MIGAVAAKWKLWLIAALVVALGTAVWQWRSEIRTAAQWAVGFEQLERQIRDQEERWAAERDRAEREAVLRRELLDELHALREQQRRIEREFQELERTDDEVASWADQRLPRALLERMRDDAPDGGDDDRD